MGRFDNIKKAIAKGADTANKVVNNIFGDQSKGEHDEGFLDKAADIWHASADYAREQTKDSNFFMRTLGKIGGFGADLMGSAINIVDEAGESVLSLGNEIGDIVDSDDNTKFELGKIGEQITDIYTKGIRNTFDIAGQNINSSFVDEGNRLELWADKQENPRISKPSNFGSKLLKMTGVTGDYAASWLPYLIPGVAQASLITGGGGSVLKAIGEGNSGIGDTIDSYGKQEGNVFQKVMGTISDGLDDNNPFITTLDVLSAKGGGKSVVKGLRAAGKLKKTQKAWDVLSDIAKGEKIAFKDLTKTQKVLRRGGDVMDYIAAPQKALYDTTKLIIKKKWKQVGAKALKGTTELLFDPVSRFKLTTSAMISDFPLLPRSSNAVGGVTRGIKHSLIGKEYETIYESINNGSAKDLYGTSDPDELVKLSFKGMGIEEDNIPTYDELAKKIDSANNSIYENAVKGRMNVLSIAQEAGLASRHANNEDATTIQIKGATDISLTKENLLNKFKEGGATTYVDEEGEEKIKELTSEQKRQINLSTELEAPKGGVPITMDEVTNVGQGTYQEIILEYNKKGFYDGKDTSVIVNTEGLGKYAQSFTNVLATQQRDFISTLISYYGKDKLKEDTAAARKLAKTFQTMEKVYDGIILEAAKLDKNQLDGLSFSILLDKAIENLDEKEQELVLDAKEDAVRYNQKHRKELTSLDAVGEILGNFTHNVTKYLHGSNSKYSDMGVGWMAAQHIGSTAMKRELDKVLFLGADNADFGFNMVLMSLFEKGIGGIGKKISYDPKKNNTYLNNSKGYANIQKVTDAMLEGTKEYIFLDSSEMARAPGDVDPNTWAFGIVSEVIGARDYQLNKKRARDYVGDVRNTPKIARDFLGIELEGQPQEVIEAHRKTLLAFYDQGVQAIEQLMDFDNGVETVKSAMLTVVAQAEMKKYVNSFRNEIADHLSGIDSLGKKNKLDNETILSVFETMDDYNAYNKGEKYNLSDNLIDNIKRKLKPQMQNTLTSVSKMYKISKDKNIKTIDQIETALKDEVKIKDKDGNIHDMKKESPVADSLKDETYFKKFKIEENSKIWDKKKQDFKKGAFKRGKDGSLSPFEEHIAKADIDGYIKRDFMKMLTTSLSGIDLPIKNGKLTSLGRELFSIRVLNTKDINSYQHWREFTLAKNHAAKVAVEMKSNYKKNVALNEVLNIVSISDPAPKEVKDNIDNYYDNYPDIPKPIIDSAIKGGHPIQYANDDVKQELSQDIAANQKKDPIEVKSDVDTFTKKVYLSSGRKVVDERGVEYSMDVDGTIKSTEEIKPKKTNKDIREHLIQGEFDADVKEGTIKQTVNPDNFEIVNEDNKRKDINLTEIAKARDIKIKIDGHEFSGKVIGASEYFNKKNYGRSIAIGLIQPGEDVTIEDRYGFVLSTVRDSKGNEIPYRKIILTKNQKGRIVATAENKTSGAGLQEMEHYINEGNLQINEAGETVYQNKLLHVGDINIYDGENFLFRIKSRKNNWGYIKDNYFIKNKKERSTFLARFKYMRELSNRHKPLSWSKTNGLKSYSADIKDDYTVIDFGLIPEYDGVWYKDGKDKKYVGFVNEYNVDKFFVDMINDPTVDKVLQDGIDIKALKEKIFSDMEFAQDFLKATANGVSKLKSFLKEITNNKNDVVDGTELGIKEVIDNFSKGKKVKVSDDQKEELNKKGLKDIPHKDTPTEKFGESYIQQQLFDIDGYDNIKVNEKPANEYQRKKLNEYYGKEKKWTNLDAFAAGLEDLSEDFDGNLINRGEDSTELGEYIGKKYDILGKKNFSKTLAEQRKKSKDEYINKLYDLYKAFGIIDKKAEYYLFEDDPSPVGFAISQRSEDHSEVGILIKESVFDMKDSFEILLHEYTHILTSKNTGSEEYLAKNQELLNIAREEYYINQGRKPGSNPIMDYYLSSLSEFNVSFTKKEVANFLNTIKYSKNKSILTRMIELFLDLFGLKKNTVLQELMQNTLKEIKENKRKIVFADIIEPNEVRQYTINSDGDSVLKLDLGTVTASENVTIDNVKGRKPSQDKNTIVAYRGPNFNKTKDEQGLIKDLEEHNMIGNPFGPYGLVKTTNQQAVYDFYRWLEGTKHIDYFQEYRKKILEAKEELKGKQILYYKDLGGPSYATALDNFINTSSKSNIISKRTGKIIEAVVEDGKIKPGKQTILSEDLDKAVSDVVASEKFEFGLYQLDDSTLSDYLFLKGKGDKNALYKAIQNSIIETVDNELSNKFYDAIAEKGASAVLKSMELEKLTKEKIVEYKIIKGSSFAKAFHGLVAKVGKRLAGIKNDIWFTPENYGGLYRGVWNNLLDAIADKLNIKFSLNMYKDTFTYKLQYSNKERLADIKSLLDNIDNIRDQYEATKKLIEGGIIKNKALLDTINAYYGFDNIIDYGSSSTWLTNFIEQANNDFGLMMSEESAKFAFYHTYKYISNYKKYSGLTNYLKQQLRYSEYLYNNEQKKEINKFIDEVELDEKNIFHPVIDKDIYLYAIDILQERVPKIIKEEYLERMKKLEKLKEETIKTIKDKVFPIEFEKLNNLSIDYSLTHEKLYTVYKESPKDFKTLLHYAPSHIILDTLSRYGISADERTSKTYMPIKLLGPMLGEINDIKNDFVMKEEYLNTKNHTNVINKHYGLKLNEDIPTYLYAGGESSKDNQYFYDDDVIRIRIVSNDDISRMDGKFNLIIPIGRNVQENIDTFKSITNGDKIENIEYVEGVIEDGFFRKKGDYKHLRNNALASALNVYYGPTTLKKTPEILKNIDPSDIKRIFGKLDYYYNTILPNIISTQLGSNDIKKLIISQLGNYKVKTDTIEPKYFYRTIFNDSVQDQYDAALYILKTIGVDVPLEYNNRLDTVNPIKIFDNIIDYLKDKGVDDKDIVGYMKTFSLLLEAKANEQDEFVSLANQSSFSINKKVLTDSEKKQIANLYLKLEDAGIKLEGLTPQDVLYKAEGELDYNDNVTASFGNTDFNETQDDRALRAMDDFMEKIIYESHDTDITEDINNKSTFVDWYAYGVLVNKSELKNITTKNIDYKLDTKYSDFKTLLNRLNYEHRVEIIKRIMFQGKDNNEIHFIAKNPYLIDYKIEAIKEANDINSSKNYPFVDLNNLQYTYENKYYSVTADTLNLKSEVVWKRNLIDEIKKDDEKILAQNKGKGYKKYKKYFKDGLADKEQLIFLDKVKKKITGKDPHGIITLRGLAGAGKTTAINAMLKMIDDLGKNALITTFKHAALNSIKKNNEGEGIKADTITFDSMLVQDSSVDDDTYRLAIDGRNRLIRRETINPISYKDGNRRDPTFLNYYNIMVVDEGHTINDQKFEAIERMAKDTLVIVAGDPLQIDGGEAKKFREYTERLEDNIRLTTPHRGNELINMLNIINSKGYKALENTRLNGVFIEDEGLKVDESKMLYLVGKNDRRNEINMKEFEKNIGKVKLFSIGSSEENFDRNSFSEVDRDRLKTFNYRIADYSYEEDGHLHLIKLQTEKTAPVASDKILQKLKKIFNVDKITLHTLGYAITAHKGAGMETDYVYLDHTLNSREMFYDALTRAKKGIMIDPELKNVLKISKDEAEKIIAHDDSILKDTKTEDINITESYRIPVFTPISHKQWIQSYNRYLNEVYDYMIKDKRLAKIIKLSNDIMRDFAIIQNTGRTLSYTYDKAVSEGFIDKDYEHMLKTVMKEGLAFVEKNLPDFTNEESYIDLKNFIYYNNKKATKSYVESIIDNYLEYSFSEVGVIDSNNEGGIKIFEDARYAERIGVAELYNYQGKKAEYAYEKNLMPGETYSESKARMVYKKAGSAFAKKWYPVLMNPSEYIFPKALEGENIIDKIKEMATEKTFPERKKKKRKLDKVSEINNYLVENRYILNKLIDNWIIDYIVDPDLISKYIDEYGYTNKKEIKKNLPEEWHDVRGLSPEEAAIIETINKQEKRNKEVILDLIKNYNNTTKDLYEKISSMLAETTGSSYEDFMNYLDCK